ncbi:MAG: biotin transporter BioY [bacterium]
MQLNSVINKYRYSGYLLFNWLDDLSLLNKLGLSFGFACLTGLMAQIKIALPFTPVPVTGQVLAVLLSGIFLGKYFGCLSQIFYLSLGTFGLPWFSSPTSGLLGITGGYLIGFVPASFIIGWLTKRFNFIRRFHFQLLLMFAGVAIIYFFGAVQFALLMKTSFAQTMKLVVFPFIPVDLIKAAIAACISASLLPSKR